MSDMVTMDRSRLSAYLERMKATSLPDEAYVKVATNDDGTDVTMVAPVFKYAIEKGKKTEIQVTDKNVAKLLFDIQAATGARQEIDMYIARKLYRLSTYDDVIKRMNFDGAIDLYCTVFGVSKDLASKRLRIGKYFIEDIDENNVKFAACVPSGWTLSHLQEVLQYLPKDDDAKVIPTFVKWLSEGVVADGMTTKKIREALKALPSGEGTQEGKKAGKKEGKKEEKQGEGMQAQSDVDVSVIDRLNDMPIDARVGHATNGLGVVEAVFNTFTFDNDDDVKLWKECIETLRTMAHAFIK